MWRRHVQKAKIDGTGTWTSVNHATKDHVEQCCITVAVVCFQPKNSVSYILHLFPLELVALPHRQGFKTRHLKIHFVLSGGHTVWNLINMLFLRNFIVLINQPPAAFSTLLMLHTEYVLAPRSQDPSCSPFCSIFQQQRLDFLTTITKKHSISSISTRNKMAFESPRARNECF